MKIEIIEADKITKFPKQYKEIELEQKESLANAFRKFGQFRLLNVVKAGDGEYILLDNRCFFDSLRVAGYTEIHVIVHDNVDAVDMLLFHVVLNEYQFITDWVKMSKVIDNIMKKYTSEEINKVLNYSKQDIEDLRNLVKYDWTKIHKEIEPEDSIRLF